MVRLLAVIIGFTRARPLRSEPPRRKMRVIAEKQHHDSDCDASEHHGSVRMKMLQHSAYCDEQCNCG